MDLIQFELLKTELIGFLCRNKPTLLESIQYFREVTSENKNILPGQYKQLWDVWLVHVSQFSAEDWGK